MLLLKMKKKLLKKGASHLKIAFHSKRQKKISRKREKKNKRKVRKNQRTTINIIFTFTISYKKFFVLLEKVFGKT